MREEEAVFCLREENIARGKYDEWMAKEKNLKLKEETEE